MSPHGLVYPDQFLQSLQVLLPRPAPHAPIRALSAQQFAKIRHLHLTSDVPDGVLFPFLHGLEGNYAQTLFFSKLGDPVPVPNYRGLIWVAPDDDSVLPTQNLEDDRQEDELSLEDDDHFSVGDLDFSTSSPSPTQSDASSVASSLDSIFSRSVSSISTTASSVSVPSPIPAESCSSLPPSSKQPVTSDFLTSTFHPSDILTITPDGPAFIPPTVPKGISLRNFGIQVPIYATLSDIVIYSRKGLTRAAFATAERFKLAIEAKAAERGMASHRTLSSSPSRSTPEPPLVSYNVFIVTDPFSAFERDFPDLVGITSTGSLVNHISFPEREVREMQDLTRATEIYPGVCVGNTADVPMWQHGDPEAPFDATCNPYGYDICIECHDQAQFPHSILLKQAEDHLAALDALWASGFPIPNSRPYFSEPTPPRPPPNANTIIHFSFPSSPPSTLATLSFFIPFLAFLHSALHRPRPCKILIYSDDGYTDSSVLALSLLMAEKRCCLPEAYLELQVVRSRSFFVHHDDLGVLKRVEAKYSKASEERDRRLAGREKNEKWGWGSLMARSNTLSFGSAPTAGLSSSAPQLHTVGEAVHVGGRRARSQTSPLLPPLVDHQSWFNDERFDGSFPSRVLPFLYLGNLNHASNAYMLHALGITHVVSVGECALVPPLGCSESESQDMDQEQSRKQQHQHSGSLWKEEREGRIKVLDIKDVCDDGIDGLRHEFASICDWIDHARAEGGKVLVHCRVGVSRSATVTIAYVMKYLHLSLVDAYLIVRSRRLSVLIQPNMRLLYNLCGWEVELARQKHGEDEAKLRCALKKSLNWPYLAREVHLLNEKYLHH